MLFPLSLILVILTVESQSGCKVIGRVADCGNLGLARVPDFTKEVSVPSQIDEVILLNNNIATLQRGAFTGLTTATKINMERNRISTIEDGAFDEVYNNLKTLNLRNNQLRSIPNDIGKLTKIEDLNIKDNAFDGSDIDRGTSDRVFRLIGNTLKGFHFGGTGFYTWPNVALTHFVNLQVLDYEGGNLVFIPYTGFHGFEQTLEKLFIRKTQMRQLPIGISTIVHLRELHFDDNTYVGDNGILAQAFATTTQTTSPLRVLSLQNNRLTRFPSVLRDLVNLEELDMDRNRLWYVADDAVSLLKRSQIKKLGLSGCSLDRIPQALLQLTTLQEVDLSSNNVNSVDHNDMSNLPNMQLLNISGNPLAYISTEAFKNLTTLHTLDLSKTRLAEIPRVILNTPRLKNLNVKDCPIECTCALTWIPRAVSGRIIFQGQCETIEKSIENYIEQRVPTCPQRK